MFKVKFRDDVQRSIRGLITLGDNLTPIWDEFDGYQRKATQKTFELEQDPYGNKWKTLAPKTWKRKKTNKIKTETGKLKRSMYSQRHNRQYSHGLDAHYAKYHETGTRKMVARPSLPKEGNLPDETIDTLRDIARRKFKETWMR